MPANYIPCREIDVPEGVRFDVPRRHQGQIVEVAYGGWGRGEHDEGDEYRRVIDKSDRSATWEVRADLPASYRVGAAAAAELRHRARELAAPWTMHGTTIAVRPAGERHVVVSLDGDDRTYEINAMTPRAGLAPEVYETWTAIRERARQVIAHANEMRRLGVAS